MDSVFIKQTLKNYYLKTNVFGLLQPSSGFYNLVILINFKFTHTHKKINNSKKQCIFKKKSCLLTNRLNFKIKMREKLN